jgi:hypothetical protein
MYVPLRVRSNRATARAQVHEQCSKLARKHSHLAAAGHIPSTFFDPSDWAILRQPVGGHFFAAAVSDSSSVTGSLKMFSRQVPKLDTRKIAHMSGSMISKRFQNSAANDAKGSNLHGGLSRQPFFKCCCTGLPGFPLCGDMNFDALTVGMSDP